HRGRSASAAALLGLALSLWSTPGASASPRPPARAAAGPRLGPARPRAQNRSAGHRLQASRAVPDWLATINRYRTAAGLAAVSDHPAWDVGLEHHPHLLGNYAIAVLHGSVSVRPHRESRQSVFQR